MRCAAAPGGSRSPRPGPRRGRPGEAAARGLQVPAPLAPRPAPRALARRPPRRPGRERARPGGRAGAGRGARRRRGDPEGPPPARARAALPPSRAGDVRLWANFLVALGGVEKAGARPAPARPETPEPEEAALEPRPRSVGAARTCPAPVFVNKPRA